MVERGETKKTTKKKNCTSPRKKKLSSKFSGALPFPGGRRGGGHSPPGLPRGVWSEGAAAICVLV